MLQSFVLAALAFSGDPPLLALYGVAMAGGVATAFDNPARRAFVVEMVPDTDVQNAVSLNSALMTGARVVGPALAGLLIVTTGYGWCFAIDGLSYVAVIVALSRMNPAELRPAAVVAPAKGQIRAGLRYVRSEPDLFVPLVMMAIVGTFAMNFNVVVPLFVKETLGGSDTTFTLLYSVVAVGSLVAALVTARRTSIATGDVVKGSVLFGISLLAIACVPTMASSFPAALFLGFASIVFMTATTVTVQLRTEPAMRGRVLALQAIVFLGSNPIGGPILGVVIERFGARAGFVVGAAACFVAAGWGAAAVRRNSRPPVDQRSPVSTVSSVASNLARSGSVATRTGAPSSSTSVLPAPDPSVETRMVASANVASESSMAIAAVSSSQNEKPVSHGRLVPNSRNTASADGAEWSPSSAMNHCSVTGTSLVASSGTSVTGNPEPTTMSTAVGST